MDPARRRSLNRRGANLSRVLCGESSRLLSCSSCFSFAENTSRINSLTIQIHIDVSVVVPTSCSSWSADIADPDRACSICIASIDSWIAGVDEGDRQTAWVVESFVVVVNLARIGIIRPVIYRSSRRSAYESGWSVQAHGCH